MRNLREFDHWRVPSSPLDGFDRNAADIADVSGTFSFRLSEGGPVFIVVASNGDGWDHVSVSIRDRCPDWHEMDRIKRIFFKPGETAMQLHLTEADHINCHPYTLHIWRPHGAKRAIPLPPKEMV